MMLTKLKVATVLLLVMGTLSAGVGVHVYHAGAAERDSSQLAAKDAKASESPKAAGQAVAVLQDATPPPKEYGEAYQPFVQALNQDQLNKEKKAAEKALDDVGRAVRQYFNKDPQQAGAPKPEQEKVQGSWRLVSLEREGIVYPEAEALKQYRYRQVEFAADKVRFTGAKDEITGAEDTLAGTFKLDPAKNPMQIEMTLGNPDEYRRMLTGIFLVERDTLKLFLAEPQEDQPREFTTRIGQRRPLLVFKKSGESDLAKLQGTWTILSAERAGKASDAIKGRQIIMTGDKLKAVAETEEVSFTLHPFRTPKAIDLAARENIQPGIYELEGDTLRLCWDDSPRAKRPGVLATNVGTGNLVLWVLKRAKK